MAVKSGSGRRVDYLSFIGIVLSLVAVLGGNLLEGGHMDSLVQLTAFIVVVGGTLGATLVQMPLKTFVQGIKRAGWVFLPPRVERDDTLKRINVWSKTVRKSGLLSLQNIAKKEPDPFIKKGLMMLVDGAEPTEIRTALEIEIDSLAINDANAARVYEAMGGYSPTIGIIGAVLGLIHVMNNLADPALLGPGIAVAFVATIYGVGFANFLFLPMSSKIRSIADEMTQYREMLLDGMVGIAEGENPRTIASKLEGYLR